MNSPANDSIGAISVAILCRDNASLLNRCLRSIFCQSVAPAQVIIFDLTTDGSAACESDKLRHRNLECLRLAGSSAHNLRLRFLTAASTELLCFLDSSDELEPLYFANALICVAHNPRIGIVYADLVCSGLLNGVTDYPESSWDADISTTNFIHRGAIFRRSAAVLARAFADCDQDASTQLWSGWRKMIRGGYVAAKQTARVHCLVDASCDDTAGRETLSDIAGFDADPICLYVQPPSTDISGDAFSNFVQELNALDWPRAQIHLKLSCQPIEHAAKLTILEALDGFVDITFIPAADFTLVSSACLLRSFTTTPVGFIAYTLAGISIRSFISQLSTSIAVVTHSDPAWNDDGLRGLLFHRNTIARLAREIGSHDSAEPLATALSELRRDYSNAPGNLPNDLMFAEFRYLEAYPEVAAAVASGETSSLQHYKTFGMHGERRRFLWMPIPGGSRYFSADQGCADIEAYSNKTESGMA